MTNPERMPIGGDFDLVVKTPLPIANYKNIAVWLVDSKCNVFGKYAINPLTEHNHTDVSPIDADSFRVKVQKSVAMLPREGVATIEIYEAISDPARESLQFAELSTAPLCDFYKLKINQILP